MFYWVFIAVALCSIFIVFYLYSYFEKLKISAKNLEKIRTKWGRPVNANRNFKMIAAYLNAIDSPAKLSASVAEDLDLNNLFNYIDRTNSKPGKQYLYKKLFTPETTFEALLKFDKKIEALNMPRPDLERIELDLVRLNSRDAYYLAELFLKEHDSLLAPLMGLYIRISVIIIIGLIISLFFMPYPASFVVLLILLTGNLAPALWYKKQNIILYQVPATITHFK